MFRSTTEISPPCPDRRNTQRLRFARGLPSTPGMEPAAGDDEIGIQCIHRFDVDRRVLPTEGRAIPSLSPVLIHLAHRWKYRCCTATASPRGEATTSAGGFGESSLERRAHRRQPSSRSRSDRLLLCPWAKKAMTSMLIIMNTTDVCTNIFFITQSPCVVLCMCFNLHHDPMCVFPFKSSIQG